ncbi:ferric uptake regulation protein [Mycobacterium sp.]|uniref:ferric uptake regulation protein n=1 Tax=Mycobacterium sp. TaxID=1785 RepID=UPI003D14A414
MAIGIKAKIKIKTCVHCGHRFEAHDQQRDLSDPYWLPAASNYCSPDCSDRYHLEMVHCCSTHMKEKARREAARATR